MDLIQKRLSKTKKVSWWLNRLPFVRCVILNGSLSGGNHKESSDIDILIIAKTGHIFTARFLVNSFATLIGIKRSRNEKNDHAGKFCFNYFLTDSFLKIPSGRGEKIDRYCAHNYSQSRFVAGDIDLYKKFLQTNQILFRKYGFQISKSKLQISNKFQNPNFKIQIMQKFAELLLNDWFERIVKKYQIRKINSNPRTKKYPTLIVFNNNELRFHPPKKWNNVF